MIRNSCLLLLCMLGVMSTSLAQNYEWMMEIRVRYSHSGCPSEKIDIINAMFNGTNWGLNSDATGPIGNEHVTYARGTNWAGIANKNISIAVKGTCSDVFITPINLSIFDPLYCGGTVFSGSGTVSPGNAQVTLKFFPIFQPVKFETGSCHEAEFTTSSCSYSGSYVWELSTNGSTYNTIARTSQSVTFNAITLISLGYANPYVQFYVRVKDATLPDRNITNKVFPFRIYAPPPTVSISSFTDVVCNGETSGSVTLQISNPTPVVDQFYINYTNRDTNVTGLVPTTGTGNTTVYDLGVGRWAFQVVNNRDKDNLGVCSTTVERLIQQPDKVAVSFNVPLHNGVAITCNGGNDGEATAVGSGGRGGYKDFVWNTTATTPTITGRTAGTYAVSLKDMSGCPASGNIELKQPAPVQLSLSPSTGYNGYPVSCWNKSDGGAASTVSGGITGQPYTYLWSTGVTTSTISGRPTGTYSVTVTDANSCTDTETITLGAPQPINFTIDQTGTLSCPGDETISLQAISVVNTIGTVSYSWSSGETAASVTGKGAGTYTLTVSDQQGCSTPKSVAVDNPRAHAVELVPVSNYNGSRIRCSGGDDGELRAIVKDADGVEVSAQNYLWTKDGAKIGEGATLTSFDGLSEAAYTVVITYGAACETEDTYTLSDPDPVNVSAQATTDYNGQPIKCFNGTDANLRATAGGGTPGPYTYHWNTGATTALITGVGAGTYVVTVRDVNLCEGEATVPIANPTPVEAAILSVSNYSGYGVSCNGFSDGTITADASGGSGGYTYSWSDGKTTPAVTGLAAGTYTLTVADNNGCNDIATQAILSPTAIAFSVAREKNISCFNGSDGEIELSASGGVEDYRFSNNNGTSWQPETIFNTLSHGTYTITLEDKNGCTKTATTTLKQPDLIDITFADIQEAFCNDPAGTARAVVIGGVGSYTYRWEDDDANVVDTDNVLSSVKGGIYTVVVQDANACEMIGYVPISSTDGAQSTYVATATKCFDSADGSAAITITAGDGPFTTRWPDGQTTLDGINLKKGLYNVLITDRNNCAVVQTVDVPAPDAIALAVQTSVVPTCHGECDGQMTLQATGGVGGYVYGWNGKTDAAQTLLCAAVYPVTITDANHCILHQDVTLAQPEPLTITLAQSTLATCKDGCDGALEALAAGGNGGYQYTWAAGGNTSLKTGLCPGSYRVSVQDAKGCQGEASLVLNNTPALPLDLGGGITLCVGQAHTLDAGAQWTSIKWGGSTGVESTQPRITINEVGSYWVDVISDKGCVAQDTFLLETSYDLLKASFMIPKEAIAGDTVVMIDISWPLPESVEWDYPLTMREVLNLGDVLFGQFDDAGAYEVGITAHLGECVDHISKTIIILEDEQENEGGKLGYEKFVKEFMVYPNPTDGVFDVNIELMEESHVILSLWNSPTGILVSHVQQGGDKQYRIHFDLPSLTAGTYLLRLDHAKGKEYVRFIVYE